MGGRWSALGPQSSAVDFYIEPEIGFRIWRLTDEPAPALTGTVINEYVWPHIEDAAAECRPFTPPQSDALPHHASVVPVKDCNCGFYGYNTYADLQRHQGWRPVQLVRGVVIGWGKTWTAEHGWRCKYARPVALMRWPERRVSLREPFTSTDVPARDKWEEVLYHVSLRYNIPLVDSPEELDLVANGYRL